MPPRERIRQTEFQKNESCVGTRFRGAVSALAAASFEIYLVQFTAIRLCVKIPFPLNILLALAITLAAALILRSFDSWAAKKLTLPGRQPARREE